VVLAVVLVDLLVAGSAARLLLLDRKARLDEQSRTTENLARVLAENLGGTLQLVDLALAEAETAIERSDGANAAEIDRDLARLLRRVPILDGIRATDATGRVLRGTGIPAAAAISVGDRDYFLHARTTGDRGSFVSSPLVSRVTGKPVVAIARRIDHRDGGFGGVVYAVLPLSHFARTLTRVDVGAEGTVALRDRDLALVARQPERVDQASPIGQKTVSPQLKEVLAAGREAATYRSASPVDGLQKLNAYRRIGDGAFHLIVSSSTDAVLAPWRTAVARTSVAVALFALLTGVAAWILLRTWRHESEVRFRKLIDGAPIAVALVREARIAYANEAYAKTFAFPSAAAAIGKPILKALEPDDAARTAERLDRQLRGLPVPPATELTLRRADGEPFRALVTDAAVVLADGAAILAFIQDVTERRRSEVDRERLIGELQRALADVKTLRGMLPICAHCKKIRDDQGYWNRIESFLREHSEAELTHGICPDCAEKYFPENAAGPGTTTDRKPT
jgi:PAS domain S-box-containing protein